MPLFDRGNTMDAKAQRAAALQELAAKRANRLAQPATVHLPSSSAREQLKHASESFTDKYPAHSGNPDPLEDFAASDYDSDCSSDAPPDSSPVQLPPRPQSTRQETAQADTPAAGAAAISSRVGVGESFLQHERSTAQHGRTGKDSKGQTANLTGLLSGINKLALTNTQPGRNNPVGSVVRISSSSSSASSASERPTSRQVPGTSTGSGTSKAAAMQPSGPRPPAAHGSTGSSRAEGVHAARAPAEGALVLGEQGQFVLEPRIAQKLYPHQVQRSPAVHAPFG